MFALGMCIGLPEWRTVQQGEGLGMKVETKTAVSFETCAHEMAASFLREDAAERALNEAQRNQEALEVSIRTSGHDFSAVYEAARDLAYPQRHVG